MSVSTTYLLNVALHAAALSVVASVVHAFMRLPSFRSMTAIAGLLAVGILPWFTALREVAPRVETTGVMPTVIPSLPVWTIVQMESPAPEAPPVTRPSPEPVALVSHEPSLVTKFHWPDIQPTLLFLWAAGTTICFLRLAIAWFKVRIWTRRLLPVGEDDWDKIAPHTDGHLTRGIFRIDPQDSSPCVTGWWRPSIVLPSFLLQKKSQKELGWAIRHEAGHWQAGDSRWMILFHLIRGMNWWNPLVRHLLVRWEEAREQLCDLGATKGNGQRADYSEFLITMSRALTRKTPLAVAMARKGGKPLGKRIRFLLAALGNTDRPVGKLRAGLVCGSLAATAVLVSGVKIQAEESQARITSVPTNVASKSHEESGADVSTKVKANPLAEDQITNMEITAEYIFSAAKVDGNGDPAVLMDTTDAAKWSHRLKSHPGAASGGFQRFPAPSGREIHAGFHWPVAGMKAKDTPHTPFLGVKLQLVPEITQDEVTVQISSDYRHMPGLPETIEAIWSAHPDRMDLPSGLDPEKVVIQKEEASARLLPGKTSALGLGTDAQGRTLWVFLSAGNPDTLTTGHSTPSTQSVGRGRQIKVSAKFTVTDGPLGIPDLSVSPDGHFALKSIFSDGQTQMIMRGISQKKGALLTTVPSAVFSPDQKGVMEVIWTVPETSRSAARKREKSTPFVGFSSEISTRFSDEAASRRPDSAGKPELQPEAYVVELDYALDYRFVPGIYQTFMHWNTKPPAGLDVEKIQSLKRNIRGRMPSGMTVITSIGEIEAGKFLTAFITADAMDATERPFASTGIPPQSGVTDATPSPQTDAKLRLVGTVVDIPSKGGALAGSAPVHPNVANAIREIPGAQVRSLPPVEIPVFTHVIPWPEIQELKVSGIISKDLSRITFARWTFQGDGDFPETWQELPAGTVMNFNIGSDDPNFERRLLMRIEPVK